ncbi:VOC family protein [Thermoleophilia bacterium SCSIO 60948]|nr:VOC family protein [Thermoleophilia bacterium SCSIO 60948]
MGARTSYAAGTFCWTDLSTPDAGAAKAFYRPLLGWEYETVSAGVEYTMALVDGDEVAGLYEPEADGPPAWLSYVAVDDVAASAERVRELGGSVAAGPVELGPPGAMAVVADPQGAFFALWQAGARPGAARVNDPGCMSLNQLSTPDPEAAERFYSALFGWSFERQPVEDPYWGIMNGGCLNGGMLGLTDANEQPPNWLAYFTSTDLDAAVETIGASGGTVVVPPMAVGEEGRIIVALDHAGAAFGLWEGRVDP